jgi:hypothetical protein
VWENCFFVSFAIFVVSLPIAIRIFDFSDANKEANSEPTLLVSALDANIFRRQAAPEQRIFAR